jgi:uncharacterized phage-associated protein
MPLEFQLDTDKVIATAIFIASHNIPDLTVGKMMKLIFLADKYHFVRFGRLITGEHYEAMEDGPVPSFAYNVFKELSRKPCSDQGRQLSRSMAVNRVEGELPTFVARAPFDSEQLSQSDILAITETIREYGARTFDELSGITHAMPAWDRAWRAKGFLSKKSRMDLEDFFEDDAGAIPGVKEEVLENDHLRKLFAKS